MHTVVLKAQTLHRTIMDDILIHRLLSKVHKSLKSMWKITRMMMLLETLVTPKEEEDHQTMFAHSSCTSLFILLFIKSTVYCIAHCIAHFTPYFYFILTYIYIYYLVLCFIFIFLHCPLSGPVLIYISLLIISCIIEYVTNKRTLNRYCKWFQ